MSPESSWLNRGSLLNRQRSRALDSILTWIWEASECWWIVLLLLEEVSTDRTWFWGSNWGKAAIKHRVWKENAATYFQAAASLCCPEQLNWDLKFQKVSLPSSIPDPSTFRDPKIRSLLSRATVRTSGRQELSFGHSCEFCVCPDSSPAESSTYCARRYGEQAHAISREG